MRSLIALHTNTHAHLHLTPCTTYHSLLVTGEILCNFLIIYVIGTVADPLNLTNVVNPHQHVIWLSLCLCVRDQVDGKREGKDVCNGSLCVFALSSSFLCLCVICLNSLAFTTTKASKGNSEFEFQWSGNTCKPGQTGHVDTHTQCICTHIKWPRLGETIEFYCFIFG